MLEYNEFIILLKFLGLCALVGSMHARCILFVRFLHAPVELRDSDMDSQVSEPRIITSASS